MLSPLTTPPISYLCPYEIYILLVLFSSDFEIKIRTQTNLTEKGFNYEVVDIVEISNFGFGRFASRGCLKILNFKHEKFKRNILIDDFK